MRPGTRAAIVTVLTVAANTYAAAVDFTRPAQLLVNMTNVGVSHSLLYPLGALKAAGAIGLLVGMGVPPIGVAAAVGLVLFFIGANITHIRAHRYSFYPVAYLLLAAGSLGSRLAVL